MVLPQKQGLRHNQFIIIRILTISVRMVLPQKQGLRLLQLQCDCSHQTLVRMVLPQKQGFGDMISASICFLLSK